MPFQEASGFCRRCHRHVLIRRASTNHILHLLLSIPTAGIWIVVWLLASVRIGGWRCTICGRGAARA